MKILRTQTQRLCGWLLSLSLVLFGLKATAQTTINTTFSNDNGSSVVTFNFYNNSTTAVIISGIGSVPGATTTGMAVSAWYKPTAINGAIGTGGIATTNGWTQFGAGTIDAIANSTTTTAQAFFPTATSTLDQLIIPAGATYGIAVFGTSLRYSTLTAGTYTETAGNCSIITGTNIGYGGTLASPTNTPRGFIGYVTFVPALPCTSPPAAGSITGADSVCANVSFNLSSTGTSFGTGMSYQWQSATAAAGPWIDIAGATSTAYGNTAGISTATYYRLKSQCSSGTAEFSPAKYITIKSWLNCYCTPAYLYGCGNGATINSVSTTGAATNISNLLTGCASAAAGYSDYTSQSMSGMQGTSFNFNVAVSAYSGGVKIWADWNHDGSFSASEIIAESASTIASGSSFTGSAAIPSSALSGNTRLRVRVVEGNTAFDPCTIFNYGETEDYTINVLPAVACTNPPAPGTITSIDSTCPNIAFTLNAAGFSIGSGLVYQWQSATLAAGPWADITGATNTNYTATTGITTATYYRLKVVCNNGTPVYSNQKHITIKAVTECYCTPTYTYGCGSADDIKDVTLVGNTLTLSNLNTPCPLTGYENYTTSTTLSVPDLTPGLTYSGTVTTNYTGAYEYVNIWIDLNNDGVFGTTELLTNFGPISNTSTGAYSINIPATASPGQRRMRVALVYGGTFTDPCGTYGFGETHDYKVNIMPLLPCTNPPNGGTVAGIDSICPNIAFTLNTSGASMGSGLVYQWQSAPAATGPWVDIVGANNLNYTATGITTATHYRLKSVCSNSTPVYSTVKSVTIKSIVNCYCVPTYVNGCSFSDDIDNVTLVGATLTLSNLNTPCSTSGYSNYTTSTTLAVPDLIPGSTYSGTVTTNYTAAMEYVKIWIDYDNDGVFNTTTEEAAAFGPIADTSLGAYSITVPTTASPGQHRMRVMLVYGSSPTDPCGSSSYGETHDYLVQIGPGCTVNPVTLGSDTSICQGSTLTLNAGSGTGLTYVWNTGTSTTSTLDVTATGTYHVTVSDGNCSKSDTIVVSVIPNPVVNLGNDSTDCVNGGPITLTAGTAPSNVYAWSPGGATTPSIAATVTGVYSVTVTNAAGCSASDTISLVIGQMPVIGGITTTGTSPNFNFTAENPANVTTYNWNFGDNSPESAVQNPSHIYSPGSTDQSYTVRLIVSNECGSDTVETSVIVRKTGINDLNLSADALKLYPNPTAHNVVLENSSNFKMKQVIITNVLGQQVAAMPINGNKQTIDVSKLTSGLYHVKVEFEEGTVTRKLEVLK